VFRARLDAARELSTRPTFAPAAMISSAATTFLATRTTVLVPACRPPCASLKEEPPTLATTATDPLTCSAA
jgi:hypothetical protein